MALVIYDRVQETSTTSGTGSLTLNGAVTGYTTFASTVGNGNTTYYAISDGVDWEVGLGTYTSASNTLSRDSVFSSSNSNALVNFSSSVKNVWVDYPASKAITTDNLAYPPAIGGTTPAAATFTTLTATGQTSLGGAAGSESLRAVVPSSVGNYWQFSGSSADIRLDYLGSGTNIGASFVARGTGNHNFATGTSATNIQVRMAHTASAVNYVQVTGAATTAFPVLSTQGSDTSIGMNYSVKGFSRHSFYTNGGVTDEQFRIYNTTTSRNYIGATGAIVGNIPQFDTQGNDANISLAVRPKGTGAIDLAAGSSGVNISNGGTVTALTVTAAGSGYTSPPTPTISAPTTASGVQATATVALKYISHTIGSGGTGYTAGDTLSVSGGTSTATLTLTVSTVSSGVITAVAVGNAGQYSVIPSNPVSVTGGTGTGATFNITWGVAGSGYTITNAGSGYVEQPTVSFSGGGGSGAAAYATVGSGTIVKSIGSTMSFYTPGGEAFRVVDTGVTTTAYWAAYGATGTPDLRSSGPGTISSTGANQISLRTNTTVEQLRVAHTASAVNYVQVTGGATTSTPIISAQGSDTNVGLIFNAKGTSALSFNGNAGTHFQVTSVASGANFLRATGSATTQAPILSAQGSDTNIDLALQPKGTGVTTFGSQQANYWTKSSAATTLAPITTVAGSDTNISMAFQSKGTGAIDLAAGSSGVNISNGGTVTAITRTAAGSGYTSNPTMTISAPTTAGGVQATATCSVGISVVAVASGGTGYTVGDTLTLQGGVFNAGGQATVSVTTVSGGVITAVSPVNFGLYTTVPANPISVTGGTGTGATLNVTSWAVSSGANAFTITNAGSGYVEQPTISFSGGGGSGAAAYATVGSGTVIRALGATGTQSLDFNTPQSLTSAIPTMRIRDNISDSYPMVNNTSGQAGLFAQGATNANFGIGAAAAGSVRLYTNGTSQTLQFVAAHAASAVNYVQVTGNVTTGPVTLSSQGSDANVSFSISSKGTGNINFFSGNSVSRQLAINGANTSVNYLQVAGSIATQAPILSAQGSDTNIDIALTPKGTGYVKVTAGTGLGYGTGTGGTVTQATSRTTGVTINFPTGAITLVSAAGTTTWQTFTVTNSAVAATDTIIVNQKSGADLYEIHVTAVAAGSFNISYKTTGGTTTEQPVFNFAVIKGVTS